MTMFPDDDSARASFKSNFRQHCPRCGSVNVHCGIERIAMTHRCRDYDGRPMFSLETGDIMERSKPGHQAWANAIYLVAANLKDVSSLMLNRDLEITRKSAWHLTHRIRMAFNAGTPISTGPEEVDEIYIGGKRKNMPKAERETMKYWGAVGKTTVVRARESDTANQMSHAAREMVGMHPRYRVLEA